MGTKPLASAGDVRRNQLTCDREALHMDGPVLPRIDAVSAHLNPRRNIPFVGTRMVEAFGVHGDLH